VVTTSDPNQALRFLVNQTSYNPFSGTYVEIDLTRQLLTYVRYGEILVQTDVVTGSPGRNTPAGTWYVLSKATNVTLVGVDYAVPVSYWMPFTRMGHGMHDANWHQIFGGTRYQTVGSHGCVNMPPVQAAKLYSVISTGTQIWIHY
jgi:lipoprotein-anchoring transpeptidase ErfK/SrfK